MKDFYDKEYNLYENADREFYTTLTSQKRLAQLRAELWLVQERDTKMVRDKFDEYTTNKGKSQPQNYLPELPDQPQVNQK